MYYEKCKKSTKYGNNSRFEHDEDNEDSIGFQRMNLVEAQDGKTRSKTMKDVQVIDDQEEDYNKQNFDPSMKFEANLVDEQNAAGGKKKKKKKKKKKMNDIEKALKRLNIKL